MTEQGFNYIHFKIWSEKAG